MRYQVKDWAGNNFETGKTKTVNHKSYGTYPLKEGIGFNRLMARPDGHDIYGKFMLIVSLCHSQSPAVRDGWITNTGTGAGEPLTGDDLHFKFGGQPDQWANCLKVLSDPELKICWLIAHPETPADNEPDKATADNEPDKATADNEPDNPQQQAESIYSAYPAGRKAQRPRALQAITEAIERDGLETVQAGFSAFVESVSNWPRADRSFIPLPVQYFSESRYTDDSEVWARPEKAPRPQSEGFKTGSERKTMLAQWVKCYLREKNGGRGRLETKAREHFGPQFAEDMVKIAARETLDLKR